MFKCCRSNDLGTWRSGVLAVAVSLAAGGIAVLLPLMLGREPGEDGALSRWMTVTSVLLAPTWMAFGLSEGKSCRRDRASAANPYRPEHQPVQTPTDPQQ
jgi:hypothetical protein